MLDVSFPAVWQLVDVKLASEPEVVSNINGSDVQVRLPASWNNKTYTFACHPCLELAAGDFVVCQVKNTFTFGVVSAAPKDSLLSRTAFLENVVLERRAFRVVVAKLDLTGVKLCIRAKRLYDMEKTRLEKQQNLNAKAFLAVLETLP